MSDPKTTGHDWLCALLGHKWWCGIVPYNGRPWDRRAAVRWCKRCAHTEAHYSRGDKSWWEIMQ